MFRPAPWKTGPSGCNPVIRAPRKYSGIGGPGTLEITRLCTTGCFSASRSAEYARTASPNSRGAANWAQSCSMPALIAKWCSLASRLLSAIANTRAAGSASWVGSDAKNAETWLLPSSRSVRSRTDTGTVATSGRAGSSACASR